MPNATILLGTTANTIFTLRDTEGREGVFTTTDTAQQCTAGWDGALQALTIEKASSSVFANSIPGDALLVTGARSAAGVAYNFGSGNLRPGVYTIGGKLSSDKVWLIEKPDFADTITLVATGTTKFATDDTITVAGVTYTWKDAFVNAANNLDASPASLVLQLRNLVRAVNRNQTSGTNYGTGTAANFQVRAQNATTSGVLFLARKNRPSYGAFSISSAVATVAWGTMQKGVSPIAGDNAEVSVRLNLVGSAASARKPTTLYQLRCVSGTNPTIKLYDLDAFDITADGAATIPTPMNDAIYPDTAPQTISMTVGSVLSWPGGIKLGPRGFGYILGGTSPIFELVWD